MQAWVGGGGAASTVFTSSMNIQYAWAGEDAQDHAGGAGYCGGGGWAEGDTHSRAGSLNGGDRWRGRGGRGRGRGLGGTGRQLHLLRVAAAARGGGRHDLQQRR